MPTALLFRLTPAGPWRIGSSSGAPDRVDRTFHSDSLYAAVSTAMCCLGWGQEWFSATADASAPAVRMSSVFPSFEKLLLAPAPDSLWPPPGLTRLRGAGARWIPLSVVAGLAAGKPFNEDHWEVDGVSRCLVRRTRRAAQQGFIYRVVLRSQAAVDRLDEGAIAVHQTACLEFGPGAGLWCVVEFTELAADLWPDRIRACFRLLSDTGLGGKRSQGWGQFSVDAVESGDTTELLLSGMQPSGSSAELSDSPSPAQETAYWLLSLFNPSENDRVDWSRGSYRLIGRGGRLESGAGRGTRKREVSMVEEGSVLFSPAPPLGRAVNVAPEGFPHPVYSAGFAVTLPIPWRLSL